jgi:hypothetical protein
LSGSGGFSNIFTSGKSLFETNDLNPLKVEKNENEESKEEEDEPL